MPASSAGSDSSGKVSSRPAASSVGSDNNGRGSSPPDLVRVAESSPGGRPCPSPAHSPEKRERQLARPNRLQVFLCSKPRRWQRRLVQRPWLLPVAAMHLAAMRIQKAWRSSWLRSLAKPSSAVGGGQAPAPSPVVVSERTRQRGNRDRNDMAAALKQRHLQHLKLRSQGPGGAGSGVVVYATYEEFCLALIQGWWRSTLELRRARRLAMYRSLKLHNVAAFEIQRHWRIYTQYHLRGLTRSVLSSSGSEGSEEELVKHAKMVARMARKVQRVWRGIVDYRVYETLRDTIGTFRRSGDPYLLLRAVLPRESALLDPAMQVHVRFRLGGTRFPPTIYYKIYTHGSVCDLGSFAPRDYARERETQEAGVPGDRGWYQRVENNGWRPLNVRLSKSSQPVLDEVEKETSRKRIQNFHHSRLVRRQDQDRKRRMKRIEWMRKLHGLVPPDAVVDASQSTERLPEPALDEDIATTARPVGAGFAAGAPSAPGGAARLALPPGAGRSAAVAGSQLVPKPPPGAAPARSGRRRPGSGASRSSEGGDLQAGDEERAWELITSPLLTSPGDLLDAGTSDDVLLDWSKNLDFEAYMDGWQRTATTDGSEGSLPIASKFAAGLVY
eukprot:TRINITY_DN108120_c0_g1_i1.p1 TRINITY_DN108120_c0_g1~~TRINITY_DN108120_c0_g1_i1.p1  ORF type:complete len:613 (+),score=87.61 TRINITY_DN108120_c0_g1_i1:114-1952(+)